jgi:hypothetical protein
MTVSFNFGEDLSTIILSSYDGNGNFCSVGMATIEALFVQQPGT